MNLNHFYHYYKSKSGGVSNLLLGSEELDQSDQGEWVRYNMNAVNANVPGVANPLSSDETVEQLDFEASTVARIAQTVTLTAGTEYTFSVWARAASGTKNFRLRYWDNVGGSGGGSAFTASATWSASTGRYEMTFTAQNSGTFQMFIQNAGGTAVSRRIYFWGAMLNVGGAALDYVKTEFPAGPSNPPTAPMEFGDNFAGVTAYYSLRRFTTGEDNNAIRVRRSSDDTEQDIGFDANGDLDTTALLAFVGQENRFKHSDPASGDYQTLLNGSTSANNWGLSSPSFTNKTILDRDLGNALAYPPFDFVETGETYTISAYVNLVDGNSATFGSSLGQQGYFNLRGAAAGSPSDYVVTNISGNIYRISATIVAGSSSGSGFLRWTNANAGEIEITGFQIVKGSTLTDYVETNADVSGFGFVTTWYDQSGNGNDATNSTASEQPLVVSGGTLVEENSKAALEFDGVDDTFNSGSFLNGLDDASVINVSSPTSTNAFSNIYSGFDSFSLYNVLFRYSDDSKIFVGLSGVSASGNYSTATSYAAQQNLIFVNFDNSLTAGNQVDIYLNGSDANASGSNDVGTLKSPTNGYIGSRGGANEFNGYMQELIFFNSDQSTNRTGIESNVNDHFSIYP